MRSFRRHRATRSGVSGFVSLTLSGWLVIALAPGGAGGGCPSAAVGDVMRDPAVRDALDDAWRDSNEGTPGEHEEGGFVFQCPTGAGGYETRIQRWPSGSTDHGAVLRGPEPPAGCRAVASFHTHPGGAGPGAADDGFDNDVPSDDDTNFAGRYGLPGIVRYGEGSDPSNTHDFSYGPPEPRAPSFRCPAPPVGEIHHDPHVRTLDGVSYDFQVEGDYLLVESGDDMAVQVRLEATSTTRLAGTPMLTQTRSIAVRIGGSTIEIGSDGLWLDGEAIEPATLATWTAPDGSSSVIDDDGAVQFDWPDGSRLLVNGPTVVAMRPAEARAGTTLGLLGDGDGDATNDLIAADGTRVIDDGLLHEDRLVGAFADGNRVPDDESLFHGPPPPLSTAVSGAPQPATLIHLADDVRAAATQACADGGIVDPGLLLDCTLDVGATGDLELVPSMRLVAAARHALGLDGTAYTSAELALLAAVTNGDTAQVIDLLATGDVDTNTRRSADGATPLMMASQLGDAAMVDALLAARADATDRDNAGTPVLVHAAGRGDPDIVQALITAGAAPEDADATGWTALHAAAFGGHDSVVDLLIERGVSVSVTDDRGLSPLVAAAQVGHTSAVQLLLASGADVDQVTTTGATALMWAATNGHVDTVRALLDAGADVSHAANDGSTALDLARTGGHEDVVEALS